MALGEALTNLVFAKVTKLADVRMSVNWMYAAKLDNEGPAMWEAANALKVKGEDAGGEGGGCRDWGGITGEGG